LLAAQGRCWRSNVNQNESSSVAGWRVRGTRVRKRRVGAPEAARNQGGTIAQKQFEGPKSNMPRLETLGSFETLVLLAVLRLQSGDNAYGAAIARELEGGTTRSILVPAFMRVWRPCARRAI
jgi:hypothetical protein